MSQPELIPDNMHEDSINVKCEKHPSLFGLFLNKIEGEGKEKRGEIKEGGNIPTRFHSTPFLSIPLHSSPVPCNKLIGCGYVWELCCGDVVMLRDACS
jgi:hypothetical protein